MEKEDYRRATAPKIWFWIRSDAKNTPIVSKQRTKTNKITIFHQTTKYFPKLHILPRGRFFLLHGHKRMDFPPEVLHFYTYRPAPSVYDLCRGGLKKRLPKTGFIKFFLSWR